MLNTEMFVISLVKAGITDLISVPCSHARDLINCFINEPNLNYIPAASESVALSIAAGMVMAGGKPIVLVQSSGFANMASGLTSLIQPYGIKFPIITSWRSYEEGDSEIQHAVLATNLPDFIQSCGFEYCHIPKDDVDQAVDHVLQAFEEQVILILQEGTFSKVALNQDDSHEDRSSLEPRGKFLEALNSEYGGTDTLFIGTTGATSREMATLMPDTKNFYMAGNMGNALSLGVGAWLQGKSVIVLGGDAESVMHMGGLMTAMHLNSVHNEDNQVGTLTYVIMNNKLNFTTGGQPSPIGEQNLVGIVEGLLETDHVWEVVDLLSSIETAEQGDIRAIVVECGFDPVYPRPSAETIVNSVKSFK